MLSIEQAAVAKGMLLRGDKQHDIAAYFGQNGGRIAEIATGARFPDLKPATKLPALKPVRFINPNEPLAKQVETLTELIKNPPENSRIIVFSPELAQWVVTERVGTGNRKKKPARIRRYSEAMAQDDWLLTGETVIFGKSGLLLDGQNRMSACVRAGKRFRTHVVFGIDDTVFIALNSGKARTSADTFQTAGVANYGVAAPAVRWLMIYDQGSPINRSLSFANQEMFEFYKRSIDQEKFALAVDRALAAVKVVPRGTLAAHLYLFDQKHQATARRLAEDFAKGQRGPLKLAGKLKILRKQNLGRIHEVWLNALLIKMWNAYRAGKTVTAGHLSWNEDQEYPTIA